MLFLRAQFSVDRKPRFFVGGIQKRQIKDKMFRIYKEERYEKLYSKHLERLRHTLYEGT
jgi:hypothetical protein